MDIILVPGFWLDRSAWDGVVPTLVDAGHTVHPLTLPGMEAFDADRSGITLADHVAAVVDAMDQLRDEAEIVLVGHSASGGLVYAATDARPGRVAHAVYVDSGPLADGEALNASFPAERTEYPLPGWDELDDDSLRDMTDEHRRRFHLMAIPQPAGTVREPHTLSSSPRRYDVPSTVIACEMSSGVLRGLMDEGHPFVAELALLNNYTIVDLPTGHWPMFTRPTDLGKAIIAAISD